MPKSLRPDPGRRPWHALLAAQPAPSCQAGAERGGRALAHPGHGGPAAPPDSARTAVGPDQRSSARRDCPPAAGDSRGSRFWPNRRSAIRRAAIGLAAHILHSIDPRCGDGRVPVGPRDREAARAICNWCEAAFRAARQGNMMVLGIASALAGDRLRLYRISAQACRRARLDPVPVRKFHEKPDARTARRYVACRPLLLERGHVLLARRCAAGRAAAAPAEDRDAFWPRSPHSPTGDSPRSCGDTFPHCENISIDYAVIERRRK